MTVTINGTSGITSPGLNSTGSNTLGDNVADTLNVGNGAIVTDASGNVGIGTSSPTSTSGGTTLAVKSSTHANMVGEVTTVDYSAIWEGRRTGRSTAARFAQINLAVDSSDNGGVRFYTAAANNDISERMRIDSSGNLLVGTTTSFLGDQNTTNGVAVNPQGRLSIAIDGANNGNLGYFNRRGSTDGGVFIFQRSGSSVGSISVTASATTYATSSDYRLKENIQPMQNALGVVAQLNPVTYTWKADGSDGQGFIAHELQSVVPDCVTGEKDAVDDEGNPVYQGIDTSFLSATLTKALQELHEIVKSQAAEIAELKAKLA